MFSSASYLKSLAFTGVILLFMGCGDEPTGPEFGDLEFAPTSPILIAAARQVDLELFNVSNESLGPLVVGAGSIPLSFPPGSTCQGLDILVAPNQIPSIAAGGSMDVSVSFSFAGLTEEECPLATYEADINAALGNQVLGSAQVRLDHPVLE